MAKKKLKHTYASDGPNIILWDIETTWGLFANTGGMLCMAYKKLGSKKTEVISLWDFKGWEKDVFNDKKLVEAVYEVLSEADGFVTHYGSRFDLPYLNSRLLFHGLPIIDPKTRHVDTWRISRYKLQLHNNRLNTVAQHFGVETKMYIGQKAWNDVVNRDKKACKKMAEYCKQDVEVLEQVYDRVLPLITTTPNYNLFTDTKRPCCPNCGSHKIHFRGHHNTTTNKYRKFQCQKCYRWGHVSKAGDKPR